MKIPEFKNKRFNELDKHGKIALIERVCMESVDYFNSVSRNSRGAQFIAYWKDHILTHPAPSNSAYLDHYIYSTEHSLCVVDKQGSLTSLRYNLFEIMIFINNAVTSTPTRSHLIDRVIAGETIIDIEDTGVEKIDVLRVPNFQKKKGRPLVKDSLAQRIKRGEITHYQAYQKKELTASDDDAL